MQWWSSSICKIFVKHIAKGSKADLTEDVAVEVLGAVAGGGVEGVAGLAGADGQVLGIVCLSGV